MSLRIENVKFGRHQIKVTFSDGELLAVPLEIYYQHGLVDGRELTATALAKLRHDIDYELCRRQAMRFLERRAHTRRELERKIGGKRQWPAAMIAHILDELTRLGIVDDERFARAYAAELMQHRAGVGPALLRQKLYQRGVGRELIDTVMTELGDREGEEARLRDAAERKWHQLRREEDLQLRRQKLYRFLIGRGFRGEQVGEVVRSIGNGRGEESP